MAPGSLRPKSSKDSQILHKNDTRWGGLGAWYVGLCSYMASEVDWSGLRTDFRSFPVHVRLGFEAVSAGGWLVAAEDLLAVCAMM